MVSRYDVAMMMQEAWKDISWKGETHTAGIYFDEQFGYVMERTLCLRFRHDEPAPSVFYRPAFTEEQSDEVFCLYPYHDMSKNPNKYNVLFKGRQLKENDLPAVFDWDGEETTYIPSEPFIQLAKEIPQKRERDRAWIHVEQYEDKVWAHLCQKKKDELVSAKEVEITSGLQADSLLPFTVNANSLLFALSFQDLTNYIHFSKLRGRIKITKGDTDIVLATSKENVEKEIKRNLRRHTHI